MEREALAGQELGEAERIALAYAPAPARRLWRGLLLLDAALSRVALNTREPMLAQIKLAWWRDACAELPASHGHPVLRVLAQAWGGGAAELTALIDAWEQLATHDGVFACAVEGVGEARALACAAASDLPVDAACRAAARRWTLTGLSRHAPDSEQRDSLITAAQSIRRVRLPRLLRPLAVLDGLAKRSLRRGGSELLGDRLSPLAAIRLGILGR